MNVKRTKTEIVGIDPEAKGLIQVRVTLEPAPDPYWLEVFGSPPGFGFSVSMHPPRISRSTVYLRAPDAEIPRYIENLDERIEATNRHYAAEVEPQLERERQRRVDAAAADQARLDAARRAISGEAAPA